MRTYYYETVKGHGQSDLESDEQALAAWSHIPNLLVIYTETDGGEPHDFRIIWEKKK